MSSQWTIGSLEDCDLSVDRPGVAGRHCRLTLAGDGYGLEDLQKRSGTFVNGVRIAGKVRVTASDAITLGHDVPMPWPPELGNPMRSILRIGREPDNDLVINLPIVSGHHARVSWEGRPGEGVIEDLGSSNGTAIGTLDRKVSRSTFSASDTIYFGNHPVPATELLARVDPSLAPVLRLQGVEMVIGRDQGCQRVIDLATVSGRHARLRRSGDRIFIDDLGSSNGTFVNGLRAVGATEVKAGDLLGLGRESFRLALNEPAAGTLRIESIAGPGPGEPDPTIKMDREQTPGPGPKSGLAGILGHPVCLLMLLLQAPILAIAIGLAFGTKTPAPMTAEVSRAIASVLFWVGLATVWFGLSNGVAGLLLDPSCPGSDPGSAPPLWWLTRLAILGTLCLCQCVLVLMIASPIGGLDGLGLQALGVLALSSLVGLATGFVIVLLSPRRSFSWAALAIALASLWLFGGGPWSLPRSSPAIRVLSNAVPSRWAFEGLLLSGASHRSGPGADVGLDPTLKGDLAEGYFPAEFDRMGPGADAMALGAMLIGLAIVGLILARASISEERPSAISAV